MLETWLDAWVAKIPWRRAWLSTLVFFQENSQGQRSLMGYSPWGLKESDTTKYSTAQSWLEEVSKSCALKKGQFVIGQENKRYSNLNIDLQCKQKDMKMDQFSSVHSLSRVQLFATQWTAVNQAFLSITNSRSPPKPITIESVMPSNHLILCHPLLLLPSIFPSIRVLSNESALCIRWPKYWSFSFNTSPSNEHPGLISFRMD